MITSIILVVCLCLGLTNSQYYEATAWFSQYASGYLKFINGHLWVELDLSGVTLGGDNGNNTIPENCFDDGVYYHIHTEWNHDDMMDYQGPTDCGASMTSGHWDPWFACSSASSASACQHNGGCISGSSVIAINESYTCSESSYDDYGYNCEVSDFSGKYGMVDVDDNEISFYESHWMEIDGLDVQDMGYSIVFHCSDDSKTRAFCAPINVTERETTEYMRETGDDTATIDFSDFTSEEGFDFDGTKVTIGEGYIRVQMSEDVTGACGQWDLELYDEWKHSDTNVKQDDWCNLTFVGGIWDPTHACVENSGSIYCFQDGNDMTRCRNGEEVDYSCDDDDDLMTCAVGDIDERIGTFSSGGGTFDETFDDRLTSHIESLAGLTLVLTCTNTGDIADNGLISFCKQIQSSDLSTDNGSSTASDEFTFGGGFAIFIIIVLIAAIGVGYWKGKQNEKSFGRAEVHPDAVSSHSDLPFLKDVQLPFTTNGGVTHTNQAITTDGTTTPPIQDTNDVNEQHNVQSTVAAIPAQSGGTDNINGEDEENNNDNNNRNTYGNTLAVSGGQAIEVSDRSPSASPAVGPYDSDGPNNVTLPPSPQSATPAGRLPPPPGRSPPNGDSALTMGGDNDDDENEFDDVMLPNDNNTTTKGGPALPPPPPNNDISNENGNYNTNNNTNNNSNDDNNDDREETPDQPMEDFEVENGQLPIEDLGDPKM